MNTYVDGSFDRYMVSSLTGNRCSENGRIEGRCVLLMHKRWIDRLIDNAFGRDRCGIRNMGWSWVRGNRLEAVVG